MGKRSDFPKIDKDKYPTPYEAVIPLFPFLRVGETFIEPCAGNGCLIDHLTKNNMICKGAWDIEPERDDVKFGDALFQEYPKADFIITNPPWTRTKQNPILHLMISRFATIAPTWLLFDADWSHTKQSAPFMKYCRMVVSVGRIKWFPDSKTTGKDNCCWYLFDKYPTQTIFIGRQ